MHKSSPIDIIVRISLLKCFEGFCKMFVQYYRCFSKPVIRQQVSSNTAKDN